MMIKNKNKIKNKYAEKNENKISKIKVNFKIKNKKFILI